MPMDERVWATFIAQANSTTAIIAYAITSRPCGLANKEILAQLNRERTPEMGKTKDVREAVESELGFDPLIDPDNITVKNINGDVALNGTVPSYPQYVEAAAAAQRVAGVKNVHNHLEVVLPPDDYRDDPMLTTMANNALELNITVPDGVEATAKNGNLTLTGTVYYGTERAAAEQTVAG
ncbi:MAG TPA: BON domain-containing protein, partial [Streptosporangiaceae bacterium]|nr:BON domain-containing protein [Streptosporangiaceae bacterium]